MSITLELGDIEQDARQAAEAAGMDLASFMREAVRAKLRENNFAVATRPLNLRSDDDLLQDIRRNFAPEFWNRFTELRKKSAEGIATDEERQELIGFSNTVLARDAERLPLLAELSRRWNTDLSAMMGQFPLRPWDSP